MSRFTEKQKRNSVLHVLKTKVMKTPYIVLGLFFYPFIKRTEVRKKYYSKDYNWWTLQLWFMLNDDELSKKKNKGYDFDVYKVKEQGIDISTKWGRFKASYWFNPWRNPGYNFSIYNGPVDVKDYANLEKEINKVFHLDGGKVNPLLRAEWLWINKFGDLDNRGNKISKEHSKEGTGLGWFNPNGDESKLYYRYSKAFKMNLIVLKLFVTFQHGHWGNKFDIILKLQREKNDNYFF